MFLLHVWWIYLVGLFMMDYEFFTLNIAGFRCLVVEFFFLTSWESPSQVRKMLQLNRILIISFGWDFNSIRLSPNAIQNVLLVFKWTIPYYIPLIYIARDFIWKALTKNQVHSLALRFMWFDHLLYAIAKKTSFPYLSDFSSYVPGII